MSSFRSTLALIAVIFASALISGWLATALDLPELATKSLVGVLAIVGCLYVFRREDRREKERRPEPVRSAQTGPYVSPYEVRFDDVGVVVLHDDAEEGRVAWADLMAVLITIQEHVFFTVPWWLLFDRNDDVTSYPSDARGNLEMLRELQRRLPDLDNREVARAMGMAEGGVVVWVRSAAGQSETG